MKKCFSTLLIALTVLLVTAGSTMAAVQIGVAAGFNDTLTALIAAFSNETGTDTEDWSVTYASMSVLNTNVVNALNGGQDTPYDLFLSANTAIPLNLYNNYAEVHSPFNYAQGTLVMWSHRNTYNVSSGMIPSTYFVDGNKVDICTSGGSYGQAAAYVLENTNILDGTPPSTVDPDDPALVTRQTQMYEVVANVTNLSNVYDIGIVGNAQVCNGSGSYRDTGDYQYDSYYTFDASAHPTISLLQAGVRIDRDLDDENDIALSDFIDFIQSSSGRAIISNYCYALPPQEE
ncbi:substrate-binding domain-containing protein [Pelobacter seleniigenes]|uniref:substrate-binding domain-containing protein n=1 Tax=Pelobacter seleniigenes TaxID=407188 RepID=UPI0004A75C68|nr:substrate-binding domain-containing protein [Pelobacter seleniigenes]